jgi:hypothetical protein
MMTNNEKYLRNQLSVLTADWTHMDWRKVRNIDYLSSDYMPVEQALMHKIERIRYYNDNGIIMPYSRAKVEMFIEERETFAIRKNNTAVNVYENKSSKEDEPFV